LTSLRKYAHSLMCEKSDMQDPRSSGDWIDDRCTGKKRKVLNSLVGLEKEYTGSCEMVENAKFRYGDSSERIKDSSSVTEQQIEDAAKSFFGNNYKCHHVSAVKYGVETVISICRSGKTVERTEKR